jgi:ABC-type antimicrobial peptide transport system permease subunit
MLKNYITIAIRHLTRHKLFSVINILCLSIGITFSMVIGVYVLKQEQVNSDLKNASYQYFIKSKWKEKGMGLDITSISPLAKTIREQYPSLVANYYRYNPVTNVVSAGDKHFKEDIAIGDTTLVSALGFPLLYGNKDKAFKDNSSAVITETMAMKLFDTKNAIGKTISIQTTVAGVTQDYLVTAVLKDIPYNSVTHLLNDSYAVYISSTGSQYFIGGDASLSWDNTNELSFIELQPGASPATVENTLNELIKKHSSDFVSKVVSAELVPVRDYYLKDNNGAVQKMILILSIVASFILLMVIINFVNINIGTSAQRLKEIGLRKVFGSARKQLIQQFIIEAWILTLFAGFISILLYQFLVPAFSNVLNTSFPPFWKFTPGQISLLILLLAFIGFAAGIYPAFVLSATNLVNAVKGKIDSKKGGLALRRSLLVIQFSLAIMVFICTLNISRQVSYIFNKDLGYNKEQVIVITAFPKQWDSAGVVRMLNIKQAMLQLPEVKAGTLAFNLPDGAPPGRIILYPPGSNGTDKSVNIAVTVVDEDYAKTFGIKLKTGSFFENDKSGFVVNETTVKQLGLTAETAIGKAFKTPAVGQDIIISGVVDDFHYSSMQEKIAPIGFAHVTINRSYRFLALKINTPDISKAIHLIEAKWKSMLPNAPFDYSFMDEKFAALYKSELQLQKAADIATILNLVIIFLGIFGVVAFTLAKRTKEIAVRKVLGADARNIIFLFLKEYALLILIANIIAWPIAFTATNYWLQNFEYRIQQNIFSYLWVFLFVFIIAFGLISVQCFKTAIANPVKSLRTD